MAVGTRMLQRRATAAVWTTSDYILASGEIGVTTDTAILKVGNGTSTWSELPIAFESLYLPLLGTATNSELLGGLSSDTFVKEFDAVSTVTNDAVARRTSTGTLKAATAAASDDLTTKTQMETAIANAKLMAVERTVTSATTLALTDQNDMVYVNHSSLTSQVVVTIPPNSSVAFPWGSHIDVIAIGTGGAKISPGAGVTIDGATNAFPGYGCVRLIKTSTDAWIGISMNAGKRLPKIRVIKTGVTAYSAGVVTCIPWNTVDSTVDFYNPDNEWFAIPGTGLSTARRIIMNKAGEYLVAANILTTVSTQGSLIIVQMTADNSLSGARYFCNSPAFGTGTAMVRARFAAGDSVGICYAAPAGGASDYADGTFDNRCDFAITRLSD